MEIVNLLLREDITDINQTDFMGNTILHRAVGTNNLQLVEALVEKGSKVAVKNRKGDTPCSLAHNGKIEEYLEVAKAIQRTL
jgi:ankyrin repeat protein